MLLVVVRAHEQYKTFGRVWGIKKLAKTAQVIFGNFLVKPSGHSSNVPLSLPLEGAG